MSTVTTSAPAVSLRPYQRDALAAIQVARTSGKCAALVVMPTGTGKTIVFVSLAQRANVRTLILAHTEELLTQPRDKLLALYPEADVGIIGGGYDEPGHQITIASVQSAWRDRRIQQLASAGIRLVIVDEAHHAVAATYLRVLEAVRAGQPGGAFLLGVTATPLRSDGQSISGIFGEPVAMCTLPEMIEQQYLADLKGLRVVTDTSLDGVATRGGDFAETALAERVDTPGRNDQIVRLWQEHAADRLSLAFCANVAHAHHLSDAFRHAGISAAAVDGSMPRDDRRQVLADFAAGKVRVLTNCAVLTEGYDNPEASCVVLARPTQSQSLFIQMVGRGARLAPGKKDCLVLDVTDASSRHKLVQLPDLVNGSYGNQDDQDEREKREAAKTKGKPHATTYSLREALVGPSKLESVNLTKSYAWKRDASGYRLDLAQGVTLVLRRQPSSTAYDALRLLPHGREERLSPQPLPLGYAQAIAEHAAELIEQGAAHLVDRGAPWRHQPASEKQIWLLRKNRIKHSTDITKGEASDLLAVVFAKQTPQQAAR